MDAEVNLKNIEHEIDWTDEKVSRLWDYYSRTLPYSEMYFSKIFGHHILKQSELPLTADLKVLDFGCGPGFIWDHLKNAKSDWKYTAIDFSEKSILKVLEKAKGKKNFIEARHIQTLPTELKDNEFDVILLFEVVEHLNDDYLNNTIVEANRLLKKGGVLVITTPNNENLSNSKKFCPDCGAIFHEWQHVRKWDRDTLNLFMDKFGFKPMLSKTLDFGMIDFTLVNILRKIRQGLKVLTRKEVYRPHLITVFQKIK